MTKQNETTEELVIDDQELFEFEYDTECATLSEKHRLYHSVNELLSWLESR